MNISFSLTTPQILARTKTVTRRLGWKNLKPGTILNACEKCQGLKRGEKVKVLCRIRVTEVRRELLDALVWDESYGKSEASLEGFPLMNGIAFSEFFVSSHKGCTLESAVTRIQFEYLD